MWSKKSTDAMSPRDAMNLRDVMSTSEAGADRDTGWLGSSLRVKGDISGTEDLLIDGSAEGLIQLDGRKLTVGPTAKVTADINARDVVVYGYVKGNVRAKGRIEIKRSAAEEADKNALSRAAGAGAGAKSI